MRDLTEQQAAFVAHFTGTEGCIGNAAAAARAAGYSERSAKEIGAELLNKQHVRAAVEEANKRRLSGSAAAKAAALLERVVEDEEAPLKVRVDAAKTILDRAGLVAPSAVERAAAIAGGGDKPVNEMSLAELSARSALLDGEVRRLRAMLGQDGAAPGVVTH